MNILDGHPYRGGDACPACGQRRGRARKGGPLHARAGTLFFASMLALGVTAAFLEPLRSPEPGSPVGGIMVCYFVATSWVAARRRDGADRQVRDRGLRERARHGRADDLGRPERARRRPPAPARYSPLPAVLVVAGLLDLNAILRGKLTPEQRIARHLWRMCFAFFIATGSFFLGQQDVLPEAVRGSPILFVLAFAPFGVMAFWLVRLRFPKAIARLKLRASAARKPDRRTLGRRSRWTLFSSAQRAIGCGTQAPRPSSIFTSPAARSASSRAPPPWRSARAAASMRLPATSSSPRCW